MKKLSYKNILAIIFIAATVIIGIISGSFDTLFKLVGKTPVREAEEEFLDNMADKNALIELSGAFQRLVCLKDYYASDNIYITDRKVIESAYDYSDLEYELNETLALNSFLKENGINFMYVNQPTKYVDDDEFISEFGVETYTNRNADRFVESLRNEGIPVLDLRDELTDQGILAEDMFYRTDHHQTVLTGRWVAKEIATALNDNFGYGIDTTVYDIENFDVEEYKRVWLGEQGKKVSLAYVGLDDYYCLTPAYETSYTIPGDYDDFFEDDFNYFVVRSVMTPETNVYDNYSWHYAYARCDVTNNLVENGNVLLICDSNAQTTEPFLSLGIHKTASVIMRDTYEDFDLCSYILENGYDTVIIAYAQTWFGAHDDPDNANARMFDFIK